MKDSKLQVWKQIAQFWLFTVIFALCWGGLLLMASPGSISTLRANRLSQQTQAAYVMGLYICLLYLCHRLAPASSKQNIPTSLTQFTQGGGLALLSLVLLWAGFIGLGWVQWQNTPLPPGFWQQNLVLVTVMALGIAWIEERVFRGFILQTLLQAHSRRWSLAIQALLYAGAHLLRSDLALSHWLLALSGLSLTGLFLGQLRLHTNSLAMSFGLHATWIWVCTSLEQSGQWQWAPEYLPLSGQGNPIYGLSGTVLLLTLMAGYHWLFPSPSNRDA